MLLVLKSVDSVETKNVYSSSKNILMKKWSLYVLSSSKLYQRPFFCKNFAINSLSLKFAVLLLFKVIHF